MTLRVVPHLMLVASNVHDPPSIHRLFTLCVARMAAKLNSLSADPADGTFVPPLEATRELELVPALIAWVAPQIISALVKALDEQRQPELSHLRRVHRSLASPLPPEGAAGSLAILLCLGEPAAFDQLPAIARQQLADCGAQPLAVQVPRHAPQVRWQFEAWTRVWPLHFHEGAAAHSLGVWIDKPPDAHELEGMREHMRRAIQLAKCAAAAGGRGVAAVFVRSGRVVAECVDTTLAPPPLLEIAAKTLSHGVAVAAASVDSIPCSSSPPGVSVHSIESVHPLGHAVLRCIEVVARIERRHKESKRSQQLHEPDPAAAATAAAAKIDHLCNECDVYVTAEPCAMCAMAMVHSRVRRVVYALPVAGGGALGSLYRLHAYRSLNHHFQVVRGMLQHEAEAAGLGGVTAEVGG